MVKAKRCPPLKGKTLAQTVRKLGPEKPQEEHRKLIRWTVTKGTLKEYASKIREIRAFALELGVRAESFSTIKTFLLGAEAVGYAASTGCKYACAWKFLLKLSGIQKIPIDQAEEIQLMLDGWEYQGDEKEEFDRGVLDSKKLEKLVELAIGDNKMMYAVGFILAWQLMIRHGRMPEFTVGDMRFDTEAGDILWVKRRKNFNRKTMKNQTRGHFKVVRNMGEIMRRGTAGRKQHEKLFPGWNQKVACEIVQRCAQQEGWDATKIWDGLHCARYGANHEERLLSKRDIETMIMRKRADWNSEGSRRHYKGR